MSRRKPKVDGARLGRPPSAITRKIRRSVLLLPAEAAAHDAACGDRPWGDWIREAAELAIARGSTR